MVGGGGATRDETSRRGRWRVGFGLGPRRGVAESTKHLGAWQPVLGPPLDPVLTGETKPLVPEAA